MSRNEPRAMIINDVDVIPKGVAGSRIKGPAICPTDDDSLLPKNSPGKQLDKRSGEYILKSGLAGGLAGCAAKTAVGPLDRVKILYQTRSPTFTKYTGSWFGAVLAMRDIYTSEGARGLFKGHSATLLRIFPYAGIKFLAYEQIRAYVIRDATQETPLRRFASGSLAGTVSVFFTYPLEVIRVRLAFETKAGSQRSSLAQICRTIYNEHPPVPDPNVRLHMPHVPKAAAAAVTATAATVRAVTPTSGLANFFRGFTPTLWGMLPYAGSSFLTHDTAGDVMRSQALAPYTTKPRRPGDSSTRPPQLKSWAELTTGAIAGFVSQTVSYPLEVIRRRMQVGGVVGDGHRLGMAEVATRIYRDGGLKGFFVGLGIGYVKVVPMVAISFFAYERGKHYLGI